MKLKATYTNGGSPVPVTIIAFCYKGNDLIIVYVDGDMDIQTSDDKSKFTLVEKLG